ncbi:MAG TPA: hypothetical protein VFZ19_06970 [Solirubrobacterales bacterium]
MSAGLPGLGLGGLFFIFSALLAPFPELWRTLRGRSDLASWKAIGRQLAQALAMVAAIDLTLRLTYLVLSAVGAGDPPAADEATVLPLNLIGITTGLLLLVLCGAKLAELTLRLRGGGLPRVPEALPRVAPFRAATFAAVAVVAWVALLAVGASDLSPLNRPQRDPIASKPEREAGSKPQPGGVEPRPSDQGELSPIEAEPTAGTRSDGAGDPSGDPASDGGGGRAESVAAPTVAAPKAPSQKPPPQAADPAPAATPAPKGSPPAQAPAGAGSPPESAGPPEAAPAPEASPPAEPPPQAPAKGLREPN